MKHAISNIALPLYDHEKELASLRDIGFEGLEVAPSRVWEETASISFSQAEAYRRMVERAGLKIIGIHSLFFDQPELGMFRDAEIRKKSIEFLVHLSRVCYDLGGKTMVYGSGKSRMRHELPVEQADEETISFFDELAQRVEPHGTCFLIEALGKNETDYIHSVRHALRIIKAVNRKEVKSHLDATAAFDADEMDYETLKVISSTLAHVHVNTHGLKTLGDSKKIDHCLLGGLLKKIDYQGYTSVEQRMINQEDPLESIRMSYSVLKRCYS